MIFHVCMTEGADEYSRSSRIPYLEGGRPCLCMCCSLTSTTIACVRTFHVIAIKKRRPWKGTATIADGYKYSVRTTLWRCFFAISLSLSALVSFVSILLATKSKKCRVLLFCRRFTSFCGNLNVPTQPWSRIRFFAIYVNRAPFAECRMNASILNNLRICLSNCLL